jgi:DNA-binding XRE family transcriptional regulator
MARPVLPAGSALGVAIRERRRAITQADFAEQLGVVPLTLSRIERGTHGPSYATAVKLAAWLGWTTDQVMEAAGRPAPSAEPTLPHEE